MVITRILVLGLLLAQAGLASADTRLFEQIRAEFGDELYPMSTVLPGYQRPRSEAPRVVVADFRVSDAGLQDWSRAISEILTYRIQYAPGVRLYMPAPYYRHVDAGITEEIDRPLLTDPADFGHLRQSLGIEYVLTGEMTRGENDVLRVELVTTDSGKVVAKKGWRFDQKRLPDVLVLVSKWIYEALGVDLSAEEIAYLEDKSNIDPDAISAFVDNYAAIYRLEGRVKAEKVAQLREAHPGMTLLAVYEMHTRSHSRNLEEAYQNLEANAALRERFSGNAGVALESFRVMEVEALPKHDVTRNLDNLSKLVVQNPQDPTFMIVYADALTDNGDAFKGLSVLIETVERWPQQYRAWWSLGWALNQLAWQIRGEGYWRDVPERAQEEFVLLSEYADTAIGKALSLNPRQPMLWSMKLNTLGSLHGYSDELMETFNQAVIAAPHNSVVYKNALHYSTANWGGHAGARKHIIDTAEKHNPGEAWVENLRKRHVVDLDNWEKRLGSTPVEVFVKEMLDHPYGKYVAVVVFLVLLIVVFQIGRRSV